jgi:NAD dependent epimerase/dehydratase family enzyme
MADALLLSSQRVIPARLIELKYRFVHPDLQDALRAVLRK